jgi:hypothetical protein
MFLAALMSALASWPHETHLKVAWLGRLRLSMQPHVAHWRDVLRGSTKQSGTPARFAL